MEYDFNYTLAGHLGRDATQHSIRLANAPLLLEATLLQIAHVMEREGRFQGQQFKIRSIGVRSDYQPIGADTQLITLKEE